MLSSAMPSSKRLVRILLRPTSHHGVIVAEPGMGKTSLVQALALRLVQGKIPQLEPKIYSLDTEQIMGLLVGGDSLRNCLDALRQAVAQLPAAIIVIEDIQLLATDDPGRLELTLGLIQAVASHDGIRLITTTTATAYQRIFQGDYVFKPNLRRPGAHRTHHRCNYSHGRAGGTPA